MSASRTRWPLLGLVLGITLSGCTADHGHRCGPCVPYAYCLGRPLPYTAYDACHCPTPVGSRYLSDNVSAHREPPPRPAAVLVEPE